MSGFSYFRRPETMVERIARLTAALAHIDDLCQTPGIQDLGLFTLYLNSLDGMVRAAEAWVRDFERLAETARHNEERKEVEERAREERTRKDETP